MKLEFVTESLEIRLSEELKLHVSRKLYKSIRSQDLPIYVNGVEQAPYLMVHKGDIITVDYEKTAEINWPLYDGHIDIAYEDDWYLIVNKRGGLLSIPTHAEPKSLYQEALYHMAKTTNNPSASILNRLDKDTKGLCVIAKNRIAANSLQPTHEKMVRKYECLLHGILDIKEGTIDTFIEKDLESNKRYVSSEGKRAISHYRVLKEFKDSSLVEFILETGRTHQIRVHSAYIGHPIYGDIMYGVKDSSKELKLCSVLVEFDNPLTKEKTKIRIPSGFMEDMENEE